MIKTIIMLFIYIFSVIIFVCPLIIYYLFKNKSLKGFFRSVGIYRPKKGAFYRSLKPILSGYLFTIFVYMVLYFSNSGMETFPLRKEYESYSTIAFVIAVIFMGLKTGILEETFFRGCITNSLIKKIGFKKANLIQAIIFSAAHILTFNKLPILEGTLLICNAFVLGYAFGYITYKEDGNIVINIIWHAIINIIAVPIIIFLFH